MSNDDFRLSSTLGAMARQIEHALDSGDVAALRRADAGAWSPAFWRLLLGFVPEERRATPASERRWGCVISLLARCNGLHDPKVRAGEALASAGWSETRLVRLLDARDEQLMANMRQVSQYLAVKQQRANLTDLAAIVLWQDGDAADDARLHIARSYYRTEHQKSSNTGENQ